MTAPGYPHPFWWGEKHWGTVVVRGEQPREARQGMTGIGTGFQGAALQHSQCEEHDMRGDGKGLLCG